jgi:hypothetical protein
MPPIAQRPFTQREKRIASKLISNDIVRCTTELTILYSTEPRDELNIFHQENKLKWLSDKQMELAYNNEPIPESERRVNFTNLHIRAKKDACNRQEDELLRLTQIRAYCKHFAAIEREHNSAPPILVPEAQAVPSRQQNLRLHILGDTPNDNQGILAQDEPQACTNPQCCPARAENVRHVDGNVQ